MGVDGNTFFTAFIRWNIVLIGVAHAVVAVVAVEDVRAISAEIAAIAGVVIVPSRADIIAFLRVHHQIGMRSAAT